MAEVFKNGTSGERGITYGRWGVLDNGVSCVSPICSVTLFLVVASIQRTSSMQYACKPNARIIVDRIVVCMSIILFCLQEIVNV